MISVAALFSGRPDVVFFGAIMLSLMIGGLCLYKRCQRRGLSTTVESVEEDERAPVVYLRSFLQEKEGSSLKRRMKEIFFGEYIIGVSNPSRDEEQHNLAKFLNQIGPYIAIGRPGETLPFPGAKKVYIPDGEWKEVASKWIDKAAALVLEPAVSGEGLSWEIGYIVRHTKPVKILIILPRIRCDYGAVRNYLNTFLPRPLPEKIPKGTRLLTFKTDWTPLPIASLYPFFKQNGFNPPKDIDPYF